MSFHSKPYKIFILFIFLTFNFYPSTAQYVVSQANITNPSCSPSSCGSIRISYPFRLRGDASSCGYDDPIFELDCDQNNQTILTLPSWSNSSYTVRGINYNDFSIRLVDPGIASANLSSCPVYFNDFYNWNRTIISPMFSEWNIPVAFIHCMSPVSSLNYVNASFCGNRSNIFLSSSEIYSYVMVSEGMLTSDLEDSCTLDRVYVESTRRAILNSSSLASIYDGLGYGFEVSWFRVLCGECEADDPIRCPLGCGQRMFCNLQENNTITCDPGPYTDLSALGRCYSTPLTQRGIRCELLIWINNWSQIFVRYTAIALISLRSVFGFPFLIGLVVFKWRSRKRLSTDESIEEFLQGQNTLAPIKYTFSEIKKMTNNFSEKLGEGGYGTVYKGKLRSGPSVAVKLMGQSLANEGEFISEVGTIGRIHHVNVVQLIGFCVERSKCALIYEFLPNGSLDRYIFGENLLGGLILRYDKMFDIALGVARGIEYLHHGCDMQILHFDIKPHNILLDETFGPKISDFGLAKLYPTDGSTVNVTAARGTMGYMAPEMFYKNVGGVSEKADVYSFGMMLLEMTGRRKNKNSFDENDMSQVFFPSWVYDQLIAGKDIEMKGATEIERKVVKKIIVVALWCIQMKPSERPSMNKVVEMLESESELQMPPKPFLVPLNVEDQSSNM